MHERSNHENEGRSTQRKETRNANELLRRDVKIKTRTGYRTCQNKTRVTKILKGSKKTIQQKMRIIPEEMTEREDKNENEVNHELDAYKGRSLSF